MNDYNELYLYNIGYHVTESFKNKEIYNSEIDNKLEHLLEKYDKLIERKNNIKPFILGIFDSIGEIKKKECKAVINISKIRKDKRKSVLNLFSIYIDIPCKVISDNEIHYEDFNTIDLLGRIYSIDDKEYCKQDNLKMYEDIIYTEGVKCKRLFIMKSSPEGIIPSKTRKSDVGFDITIIKKIKQVGDVEYYDTGIVVIPEIGFYCEIAPRSSISKTGYMLANSVGIIDPSYRGNLIIALMKVDKNANQIKLPCKIAQLIPRRAYYPEVEVIYETNVTERNKGGFGSTDQKE